MKKYITTVYTFDELTEAAQRRAWENNTFDLSDNYGDEYRATFERDNCTLTGVCYDVDILEHVNKCLEYKEFFDTFDDLITACLDQFFRAWRNEIDYCNSFEYFAETAAVNKWEFTANGDFWTGGAA